MKTQTKTKEEMNKYIKEIRIQNKKRFPVILRNKKTGSVLIITETTYSRYELKEQDKVAGDSYNEIQMALGSGYKRIKDETEKEDWRFN